MSSVPMLFLSVATKGTLVLAAVGLVALGAHKASAAFRHAVWAMGLAGLVLIPVLSFVLPRWRILPSGVVPGLILDFARRISSTRPVASSALAPPLPASGPTPRPPRAPLAPGSVAARPTPAADPTPAIAPTPAVVPTTAIRSWSVAPVGAVLTGVWLGGFVLGLFWITAGEWWVRRVGRRARPAAAEAWTELVPEALEASGVGGPIRLLETDAAIVPMTYGWLRPVVLVPVAGRNWTRSHRRDVLLHELAHVRRRDCLVHLVARVASALHWFNPLAWLALRRLRIERERACDDAVLNAGALPSCYADELLSTAQVMRSSPGLASAGLGMARRSQLADRLLLVLDPDRRRTPLAGPSRAGVIAAGFTVLLPLSALGPAGSARAALPVRPLVAESPPSVPVPTPRPAPVSGSQIDRPAPIAPAAEMPYLAALCPPGTSGREKIVKVGSSMSISGEGNATDGKNSYLVWTGDDCSVVIHTTGTVTFTEDERDVASISRGGRFAVTHEDPERRREYVVVSRSGELERRYSIDDRPASMDAEFEEWRAAIVLECIRRSGYDAERRARHILATRGFDAVLAEIDSIANDWSQARYLKALATSPSIDAAAAGRLVDRAGRWLDSDYELGRVLAALPPAHLESEPVRESFVRAAGTMESDYEKRKVLGSVLAAGRPGATAAAAMLELAATIDSDYELAELLVELAKTGSIAGSLEQASLTALATIESDYEKHRVLSALLANGSRATATLKAGLEAAASMESDFETASWLKEVAAASPITEELRGPYFAAVASIESDYERRGVLSAALATKSPSTALVSDLLAAAAEIESDYELATLLVEVADRGLVTADTRASFMRALATIESTHERQRALAAVGGRNVDI